MKIGKTLILIVVVLIAIAAIGATMALTERTLAPWWQFWGWALAAGIVLSIPFRGLFRRLHEWQSGVGNQIIAGAYFTLIAAGCLYAANYAFADASTEHTEQVTVERKFTKTRHHSRRVGRRYVQGDAYKVYFIEVRFENGRTTELEIPIKRYNRLRTGGTTNLNLATGLFGAPVIKF